jgi:hypothetical protein
MARSLRFRKKPVCARLLNGQFQERLDVEASSGALIFFDAFS